MVLHTIHDFFNIVAYTSLLSPKIREDEMGLNVCPG
jgi:hypothetical protein